MYIYLRTNKINGKMYVGQTIMSLQKRWSSHKESDSLIGQALRKYGEDNFDSRVLEECDSLEMLNFRERCYILALGTLAPHGYNLQPGGDNKLHHDITKVKISERRKGKGCGVRNVNYKRDFSSEHRLKISSSLKDYFDRNGHPLKGAVFTDAHIESLKDSHKGQIPWNKGKKLSKEHVENLRVSHRGRTLTKEHKRKISEAMKKRR